MSANINTQSPLISAICNLTDTRPLDEAQTGEYAEFQQAYPLEKLTIQGAKLSRIDHYMARAEEVWPQFEAEMIKILTPENQVINMAGNKSSVYKKIAKLVLAACVLLGIGFGVYKYYQMSGTASQYTGFQAEDIAPGGYKATLFLSNKKPISLETVTKGQVLQDAAASIEKRDSGSLFYQQNSMKTKEEASNTLITPRAGMFSVRLSDGSKVYLNAESSLEYPAVFNGPVREVILSSGEAYFEVAPGDKPFIVKKDDIRIEVHGTKFNINSYKKEKKITTTLLEGAIRFVQPGVKPVELQPAQQLVVSNGKTELKNVYDPENAISWVGGNFSFEELTLREIMYQVERWYDVTVIFEEEPDLSPITIRKIPKTFTLGKLLDVLKEGDRFTYTITEDKQKVIIKK